MACQQPACPSGQDEPLSLTSYQKAALLCGFLLLRQSSNLNFSDPEEKQDIKYYV